MTQKITMGRDKRQDAIDAENARRQAGRNPFVQGIDAVMEDGVGKAISQSRNQYGNANIMTNEVVQGSASNFSQKDEAGNMPMEDYANQTGSVDYQTSSTERPEQDPEDLENDALERRVKMIQRAAGNAEDNLNGPQRGM